MAKRSRSSAARLDISKIPDHPVPEALNPGSMKALTPGRLSSYQKKVFAHFTPYLEIPFFQSLSKLISAGDPEAMELYAKVSKKIEVKSPIQINNNVKQNSDNDNRSIQAHGVISLDQIKRELQDGRAVAAQIGPAPTPIREKPEEEGDEE